MNSPLTGKLWKWGALFFVGSFLLATASPQAKADDTPTVPTSPQHDAPKFLRAVLMRDLYRTPLDFKAENLTVEEVVERTQKVLLARKPTLPVRIEVRDVLPVKLSVGVKGSTVGRVLSSTATLAGGHLWIFEDYALLAPEKALTPTEQENLSNGFGVSWPPPASTGHGQVERLRRKAMVAFILNEINASAIPDVKIAGLAVGQFSPAAQTMLRELVNENNQIFTDDANSMSRPGELVIFEPFEFSLDAKVRLTTTPDSRKKELMELDFPTPGQNMRWPLDGWQGGFSAGFRGKPSTSPKSLALPLDLSAGKS